MTIKGGTNPACAACKYQRRKCAKNCPLAPYFPPDKPILFQNAHRLYGVSNIMKILKDLREDQKEEAMKSIIYESNMRAKFPVHGCSGIINELRFKLNQTFQELYDVRTHLAVYHNQNQIQMPDFNSSSSSSSQVNLGTDVNNNLNIQHASGMLDQYFIHQNNGICNEGIPIQQEIYESRDYNNILFDANVGNTQSYIEPNQICCSSVKVPIYTTESMGNSSMNAAACFGIKMKDKQIDPSL